MALIKLKGGDGVLGIIPGSTKTFIVEAVISADTVAEEGKLYADPKTGRIYYYSSSITRSCPLTGFFPVWDGKSKHVSQFSNEKYLEKDVIGSDVSQLAKRIDGSVAKNVRYLHRRSASADYLKPVISDNDNMFTQVIKGIILGKQLTIVDLIDLSGLSEKVIVNYYSALTKIAFMRMERWEIWIKRIFNLRYDLTVYKADQKLVSYAYPENEYDTGVVQYDAITLTDDDQFKKLVRILMIKENISKHDLRSDQVDDYTINNMLTTLGTKKPLSAQLFSRFIRMASLNYTVEVFEDGKLLFEYKE
jgi:hypothetical protein